MPRRASKWLLQNDGKAWNLSRGGRVLYGGMRSEQEALQRLKNHYRPGEPVVLEEEDGYQTNITERLKRAGIL